MEVDYEKFGLKCGIEIHQQLNTNKLFCNCPSELRDDEPHFKVNRRLRAVAGETGEVDIAAQHETAKEKQFVYEGYSDTTCLIEFDEAPPNPLNSNALKVALQMSLLLNTKPVDEIQIMRKTVVDGSNTTGFQRTALVSKEGHIATSDGEVSIESVCIEEESAKIIRKENDTVIYRLDRLGIPLVEIATGPDIKTPKQCKEVAEKIGMFLRSTGKVKRGIGTIRQDVNVSIKEGNRVEIKGVQELKLLPLIIELEIIRQLSLIEVKNELEEKKAAKTKMEIKDVSDVFKKTECSIIKKALDNKGVVLVIPVPSFGGILKKEIQKGRRLGTELSDHAKHFGLGGLFHSDENLFNYGMSKDEIIKIANKIKIEKGDAFILLADKEEKATKAMEAVKNRILQCFEGIPKEVRSLREDGTTSYMRPMPGASRMYPETDVVPVKSNIDSVSAPELIDQKIERFEKEYLMGLDLAEMAAYSEKVDKFEEFVENFPNLKPSFIAETFMSAEKSLSRKYEKKIAASDNIFEQIFKELEKGNISKEIIPTIIIDYSEKNTINMEDYKPLGDKELEEEIKKIFKEHKGLEFNKMRNEVMTQLKGKGDPRKIIEIVMTLQKI